MEELARFRQLIELARTGNYRKAARNLSISHSALSQTISKLEARYGVELFSRGRRGTVPTAYGERLVQAAVAATESLQSAEREINLMQSLEAGRLIVGVDPTLSEGLMGPVMALMLQRYPKLQFTLLPRNWRTMEYDLRNNEIDIFVGLAPDRRSDYLYYEEFPIIPPVPACRAKHPLHRKHQVNVKDLFDFPVVGADVPDWYQQQVSDQHPEHFPTLDALRSLFLTTQSMGVLRHLLAGTDAIGFVPEALVAAEVGQGRIKILEQARNLFAVKITGVVATRDDRPQSPAAQHLSRIISDMMRGSF